MQNIVTIRMKHEVGTPAIRKIPHPRFKPIGRRLATPSTRSSHAMTTSRTPAITNRNAVSTIKPLDFSNLSKIDLPQFPVEFLNQRPLSSQSMSLNTNSDDSMTTVSTAATVHTAVTAPATVSPATASTVQGAVNVNDLMLSCYNRKLPSFCLSVC